MKKLNSLIITLALFSFVVPAYAISLNSTDYLIISSIVGHSKTKELTYPAASGTVRLFFTTPISWVITGTSNADTTSCSTTEAAIAPDDNQLVSLALYAKSTGKKVKLYIDTDAGTMGGDCILRALEIQG